MTDQRPPYAADDDLDYDSDEYASGYWDGYAAGKKAMTLRNRLIYAIPLPLRQAWFYLQRRLYGVNDADIPF